MASAPANAGQSAVPGMQALHPVFTYAIIFSATFVLHAPLLRLPYFWDEAGYYVPAARDLLLTHSLIPHSTLTVAHPPLVLTWLALWWRFSGYTPAVTRTAMLMIAALALTGAFRLAKRVASVQVAIASTIALALYPVFFAQSSMAHLDMAAAALTLWGLTYYLDDRRAEAIGLFCLAVLCKETAVITPIALAGWESGWRLLAAHRDSEIGPKRRPVLTTAALGLTPIAVLAAWYGFHYAKTGFVFGNPQFLAYNVGSTLHPLRIVLALVKRLWQLTAYMNLFVLTAAALAAMLLPPQSESESALRSRISLRSQATMGVVVAAYAIALSLVGGAVLARYMLPVIPLIIIVCVSTLWRRVRQWVLAMVTVCAGFVLGLFVNPPYTFAPEDNLAYRDYVLLHSGATNFLERHFSRARVLTAWPGTDELSHPYLGYAKAAIPVVAIENFSPAYLIAAARDTSLFDVVFVFSTKYEPARDLTGAIPGWERLQMRFFGFHRDVPPQLAALMLDGRVVYEQARQGQWVAVIEIERPQYARSEKP